MLRHQNAEKLLSGAEPDTTNNRMELMAAIVGLEQLKVASQVRLTTDSQYVRQGITAWIAGWRANGWRTANRKPVKNQDLWMQLAEAHKARPAARFRWVRGHSGHPENERADALALAAARSQAR